MRGCRPLTDTEITEVLYHLRGRHSYRDRALFTLALKSGLRITCLLALKIEDVWDGDVLRYFAVRKSTVKGKRAGFSHPMHPVGAAALREYIDHRCGGIPGNAPLLCSGKRNPDGTPGHWIAPAPANAQAGLRSRRP